MNCLFSLETADFRGIKESTSLSMSVPYLCGWLSLTSTESSAMEIPERAFPVSCCESWQPGVWKYDSQGPGVPDWAQILPFAHTQLHLVKPREGCAGCPNAAACFIFSVTSANPNLLAR